MKTNETTKAHGAEAGDMTLASYYERIPVFPKQDFIREVCRRCEVTEGAVRNWIANRSKPQKASHYRILAEMTGIPAEELFRD